MGWDQLPCCSKQSMKLEFTICFLIGSTAAAPWSTWSHCSMCSTSLHYTTVNTCILRHAWQWTAKGESLQSTATSYWAEPDNMHDLSKHCQTLLCIKMGTVPRWWPFLPQNMYEICLCAVPKYPVLSTVADAAPTHSSFSYYIMWYITSTSTSGSNLYYALLIHSWFCNIQTVFMLYYMLVWGESCYVSFPFHTMLRLKYNWTGMARQ